MRASDRDEDRTRRKLVEIEQGIGAGVTGSNYKYPGFISYSHRDRKVAEWLHRALESYRVPKHLIGSVGQYGPVPARLYPIFRDREELSAGALAEQLRQAIAQSRCYILICSPHAATSRWVNEEVEHFLNVRDPASLLCLIVDGEPNATAKGHPERECFPPALRQATVNGLPLEPMAAQLDDAADGRDNARLKLIAGLLGVGFDELKRRDLIARNRRLAVLASLSLGVAAVTVALAIFAILAQREAEHSRQQGEELIGFMLGDLRGKLEPLGKLDILDAVGDRATAYFAGLDRGSDPGPRALAARAKALRQIGEVRFAQGRPADAVETLSAALKLQRDLVAAAPDDNALLFELGQTEFWVGYAGWRAGQFDQAETNFLAYQAISQKLVSRDPANRNWQIEVAYALNNLAILAFERRRYTEALPLFEQVAAKARGLLDSNELAPEAVKLLGALSWQGSTLLRLGRDTEALAKLQEHTDLLRALVRSQPDDLRQRYELVFSLSTLGYTALDTGETAVALSAASEGAALARQMVDADPTNYDYRQTVLMHSQITANAEFQANRLEAAASENAASFRSLKDLLSHDGTNHETRRRYMTAAALAYEIAWLQHDVAKARSVADEALSFVGTVLPDAKPDRIDYAQAHLYALELAVYEDHDDDAAQVHREAARAALIDTDDNKADDLHASARLRALLGLMSGADHIPDAALPNNKAPWTYSVQRFVDRHCGKRNASLSAQLCSQHSADARHPSLSKTGVDP